MNKKKFIAIVASLFLISFGANAQGKTVKTIFFEGGSCKLYELVKNSMFAPANMQKGEKAFMLRLKCSLKQNAGKEALSVLYNNGEFITPDGKRYKAGTEATLNNDDGLIYSLIVAVPESVDVTTLKFVYNKQVMLLDK